MVGALSSAASAVALPSAARRVCVLSEDLSGAADEGIKKFALALADALGDEHAVALVSTRGAPGTALPGVRLTPAPPTFLSRRLRDELNRQQPEVILYVATASTTFMAFVRSRVLRVFCPRTIVVLIGLQPRRHSRAQQFAIRYLAPDQVWVQTSAAKHYLEGLGCTVEVVPSGVDVETFQRVGEAERTALRALYGLGTDRPVVLHVGHLSAGRGIRELGVLAARGNCQVVLVTSSSTVPDHRLAAELRAQGVHVFSDYQPHIEHFYQLADCYVFPVPPGHSAAIDMPLSVLEALACDLPVVSTRFGALEQLFGRLPSAGLTFANSTAELVEQAERACGTPQADLRALVLPYAWSAIASALLARAVASPSDRQPSVWQNQP